MTCEKARLQAEIQLKYSAEGRLDSLCELLEKKTRKKEREKRRKKERKKERKKRKRTKVRIKYIWFFHGILLMFLFFKS